MSHPSKDPEEVSKMEKDLINEFKYDTKCHNDKDGFRSLNDPMTDRNKQYITYVVFKMNIKYKFTAEEALAKLVTQQGHREMITFIIYMQILYVMLFSASFATLRRYSHQCSAHTDLYEEFDSPWLL